MDIMAKKENVNRLEEIAKARAEHPEAQFVGKEVKDGRFVTIKNKKSQAVNSVNNVFTTFDDEEKIKYTFSITCSASGNKTSDEFDADIANARLKSFQDAFTVFLDTIHKSV